jgi:hypothetical protein
VENRSSASTSTSADTSKLDELLKLSAATPALKTALV